MKNLLLAGTALGGLALAGPGLAADLPVKAAPPMIAPAVFSWTGCYIGGNVGGAVGQKEWSNFTGAFGPIATGGFSQGETLVTTSIVTFVTSETVVASSTTTITRSTFTHSAPITSVSDDSHGFLAGGQIGCDLQFAPRLVIGIEGRGDWAHLTGTDDLDFFTESTSTRFPAVEIPGMFASFHSNTRWLASATVRLGFTPWDRWLFYTKGGAAWAGDRYEVDGAVCGAFTVPRTGAPFCNASAQFGFEGSETRFGWTTGLGIEYAFADGWSAQLEWDYYNFGRKHVDFNQTVGAAAFRDVTGVSGLAGADIHQTINALMFGINYRFGIGIGKAVAAPVVARY